MAPPTRPPFALGFAADAPTERALRSGLAGRDARVRRGRLAAALRHLAAESAPRLVFVDLDGVRDPAAAARQVTEVCAVGTTLVAIGSVDTAEFSRQLLQGGVSDYFVKPISPATVREASLGAVGDLPDQRYAGRVVAFGGSAGSGTSTLIAAVARSVATDGRAVSVIDLDPVAGKLEALLGNGPAEDLPELLQALGSKQATEPSQETSLGRAAEMRPSDSGMPHISLFSYPPLASPPAPLAPYMLEALLKHLANRTHMVLVSDVSGPDMQIEVMRQADARVLLYEPTLSSISVVVRRLAWLGTDHHATLIECLPRMRRYALSPANVRYALAERRPDVIVPFEPTLHASATGSRQRRPSRAYQRALKQVMEIIGQGARL
jgi:pilus assembly protein CpaE